MYTWTHGLAGWLVGRRIQKDEGIRVPLACFCGAIISDIPLIAQIFFNWAQGRQGEGAVVPFSEYLTEIGHSLLWWGAAGMFLIGACGIFAGGRAVSRAVWGFFASVLIIHIGVDMLTHKGLVFANADYLSPLSLRLAPILGVWNYRSALNAYMPKWQEWVIDIVLVLLIAWMEYLLSVAAKRASDKRASFSIR